MSPFCTELMVPAAADAGAGFLTSQDDLGKTKRSLGLGAAYLGLVLTKTDQDKGWNAIAQPTRPPRPRRPRKLPLFLQPM
jgi:hypothetical protein